MQNHSIYHMGCIYVLSLVNNIQKSQCNIDILPRRRLKKKRKMNDINEALFCNRPSDFTQTKLMVHHHRRDDENYIGSSGGSMTMGMVIAGGGSNHGEEQLKGFYIENT